MSDKFIKIAAPITVLLIVGVRFLGKANPPLTTAFTYTFIALIVFGILNVLVNSVNKSNNIIGKLTGFITIILGIAVFYLYFNS